MSLFQASQYTAAINEYHENFYIKPYTRFGPYLIGLMLGHKLHTSSQSSSSPCLRKCIVLASIVLLAWSVAGVYPNHFSSNFTLLYTYGLVYGAIHRTTFAVGIALIIRLLYAKQATSRWQSLLTCKSIVLMANLSYGAYLMQMVPIVWFLTESNFPHHFHGIYEHATVALIVGSTSYIIGFFYITASVEMPAIALERLFIKNSRKNVAKIPNKSVKNNTLHLSVHLKDIDNDEATHV